MSDKLFLVESRDDAEPVDFNDFRVQKQYRRGKRVFNEGPGNNNETSGRRNENYSNDKPFVKHYDRSGDSQVDNDANTNTSGVTGNIKNKRIRVVPELPDKLGVTNILASTPGLSIYHVEKQNDLLQAAESSAPRVLRSELVNAWEYKDGIDSYFLVRHVDSNPTSGPNNYNDLRGVIVDMATKQVVCKPFIVMNDCVHSQIVQKDGKYLLSMIPHEIGPDAISLPIENAEISMAHEGPNVTIWKDLQGRIHMSAIKKIDMDKSESRWNGSLLYSKIWDQLKGTDPSLFFDEGVLSPYCYTFCMSYPDLFFSSKEISVGILAFLGCTKMNIKYPADAKVATAPKDLRLITSIEDYKRIRDDPNVDITKQLIFYTPPEITLDQANYHLKYGRYREWDSSGQPSYTGTGEYVMIRDKINNINYRVMSDAYHWRSSMRTNGNIVCNAFTLFENAKSAENFDNGFFPQFYEQNIDEIEKTLESGKPIIRYPSDSGKLIPTDKYDGRLTNIWLAYILAVPITLQRDAFKSKHVYESMIRNGADNLIEIMTHRNVREYDITPLMATVYQRACDRDWQVYENRPKNYVAKEHEVLMNRKRSIIYQLKFFTPGARVYSMLKFMRRELYDSQSDKNTENTSNE